MTIKAVYFDLDNTLVHRAQSIEKFSLAFIKRYGCQLETTDVSQISSLIKVTDNGGYLPTELPKDWHKGPKLPRISDLIGIELAASLNWIIQPTAEELTQFWQLTFPQCAVEMPGAKELLLHLDEKGYFIGIISNGAQASRAGHLAATSFAPLVQQMVSSEAFGLKKPHRDIFIQAISKQGFRPQECVFIGDHPVNDYQGALSAGMNAILLLGFHTITDHSEYPYSIQHLSEAVDLVATF
ncbi:HAD family hydrolase [Vibrio sp. RC27]